MRRATKSVRQQRLAALKRSESKSEHRTPTIAEYFREHMGRDIIDPDGRTRELEWTILTDVGGTCARAIEAGSRLLSHLQAIRGDHARQHELRTLTELIVLAYAYRS